MWPERFTRYNYLNSCMMKGMCFRFREQDQAEFVEVGGD